MKKKITIRFIVVLQVLSLLFCSSCELNDIVAAMFGGGEVPDKKWEIISDGLATSVSGRFYDYYRDSSVTNLKVFVDEYVDDPVWDLTFSRHIDSTLTDQNGNFKIPFITTGVGVQYQLSFKLTEANWLGSFSTPLVIKEMGTSNIINVQLVKLSILKARVKVVDNLHPPMTAGSSFGSLYQFNKANQDSIIFLRVIPNRINQIRFFVQIDTVSGYYYRERIDSINMTGDFSDTIKAEFELHPNQFKKQN